MPRRRRRWVTRVDHAAVSRNEFDFQDGIYIPTIDVLRGLRKEGFEPFMVAQGKSRVEGKAEFTKWYGRLPPRCLRKSGPSAGILV